MVWENTCSGEIKETSGKLLSPWYDWYTENKNGISLSVLVFLNSYLNLRCLGEWIGQSCFTSHGEQNTSICGRIYVQNSSYVTVTDVRESWRVQTSFSVFRMRSEKEFSLCWASRVYGWDLHRVNRRDPIACISGYFSTFCWRTGRLVLLFDYRMRYLFHWITDVSVQINSQ